MADDFLKKFENLAGKLSLDPKKDGDLKKAIDDVTKAFKSESDDYSKKLKVAVATIGKKKKDISDKNQKKALEQLETLADEDLALRFDFKDASTSPS
jgi:hypothetical protein